MKSTEPNTATFFRMLNQVSDPVFLLNPDLTFLWSNDAYCKYMDISTEKIKSMKIEDVIPAEYSPVLTEKYRSISVKNPVFDNIYPSILQDGSIIIEKWHNEGVFDDDGNILYYYCIASLSGSGDEAPLSLKDQDLISNTLIKSTLLGIIIAIDQKIIFINQKAHELLALEGETAYEETELIEFFKSVFPKTHNLILGDDKNRNAGDNEIQVENGESRKWLSVIRKYQIYNNIQTAIFLIEDITARKENELETEAAKAHLSKVMHIAKIGYWEKNYIDNSWTWSDEIYDIYEIERGTIITDEIIAAYLEPESFQRRARRIEEIENFEGDSFSYQLEYRINPPGKPPKWISGESYYEKARSGRPERLYGWCQDITQRKQIEENLRLARDKAEESERLKTAFLANMSHEIRTPLNAILGFSDLITRSSSENEKKKFRKIINQSSRLLLKIIDDILNISAIESGSFELFYEKTNVNHIFNDLKHFYSDHEHSYITLDIQRTENEIELETDLDRIKQILINLINNAFKYTRRGKITVSCTEDEADNSLVFSVKDTGEGIPHTEISLIFERFYQSDSFSKGTGLGLAISKSIIDQMGGKISVKSNPGEGSEFIFTIPLK